MPRLRGSPTSPWFPCRAPLRHQDHRLDLPDTHHRPGCASAPAHLQEAVGGPGPQAPRGPPWSAVSPACAGGWQMHLFFFPPWKGCFPLASHALAHPPIFCPYLWPPSLPAPFLQTISKGWRTPASSQAPFSFPLSIFSKGPSFLSDVIRAHGFELHSHAGIPKLASPAQTSPLRSGGPLLSCVF